MVPDGNHSPSDPQMNDEADLPRDKTDLLRVHCSMSALIKKWVASTKSQAGTIK